MGVEWSLASAGSRCGHFVTCPHAAIAVLLPPMPGNTTAVHIRAATKLEIGSRNVHQAAWGEDNISLLLPSRNRLPGYGLEPGEVCLA